MKPTSIPRLLAMAAIAALVGWGVAAWIDGLGRLPAVPWLAVLVVWTVAVFVGVWAFASRRRLHPKPGMPRMAALTAARTTALALAGSRTGAVVLGVYAGIALRLTEETAVAAARERLLAAVLASLGGLLLAAVSLWLEHLCRLPDDDEESRAESGRGSDPGPAGAPS